MDRECLQQARDRLRLARVARKRIDVRLAPIIENLRRQRDQAR